MEVLYARCCGLDVHRDMVVACLSIIEAGQRRKEIRTFRTVTKESTFHERVAALRKLQPCRNGKHRRALASRL